MRSIPAIVAFTLFPSTAAAQPRPILYDPIALNIGVSCHWQSTCMSRQRRAMKSALAYVAKAKPPQWKIQLCNRNASRGGVRVDWIGFDHCIRNPSIKAPASKKRKR